MKRVILIAAFAALHVFAYGANKYIKVGGNNSNSGDDWANAWAHPNKTNGSVTYGDVIYIAPGTYDTVDIRPVAGITFRCAGLPDATDSGRSTVILRGTTTLGGTWTNRGSNIWRHDQTVPPRWNAWTMSSELGHMILVRDNVMQHPVARHLNLASCDEALEFWYDVANDSLFIYSTTDPSGATFRYGQAPIVRYAENANEHNVKFIGLTLSESFQGHFMMATGDWSGSSYLADSLFVSHCNLWKSSLSMSGGNLGIFFAGFQAVSMTNVNQWGRFSGAYACSLDTCWAPPDDYSGGGGCDFYSQREFTFDSCYFGPSLRAGGVMFKMGGALAPLHSFGNVISNNVFDGGRAAMWFGMMQDSLLIYGNIFKNQTYRGIDIHSTPSNVPLYGRLKIFNNTFWNSGAGDGEAITLTPIITDSTGSNEIKYNVIFDTATAINAIAVRDQGEATDIDFVTHIVIDSNMYYRGGTSFATQFPIWCACTGTNFAAWQSCGFDVHGTATTNPNFFTSQTPTAAGLARPSASGEMARTYGGQTWTVYGAIQPAASGTTAGRGRWRVR